MNKLTFAILLTGVLFIFSCKSTKNITQKNQTKKIDKIFETLESNQVQYNWLSAKANVKVQTKSLNQNARLHLRMRNDSLIWGSITYLFGFEVARFFADKENLTFIDKIRGIYYQYPYSYIEEAYGIPDIDFSFLENLVLGNPVYEYSKGFEANITDDILVLTSNNVDFDKTMYIKLSKVLVSGYKASVENKNQLAVINYTERIEDQGISIPANVEILLQLPEKNSFTLNFISLQLNKPFSLSTSIPSGYEKAN